MAVKKW